jgi:hypothetical protein
MKKVSVVLLLCAMAMTLSLTSCGGGGGGGKSPADIEKGLWKLIQKGNFEKAGEYWMENSIKDDSKGTSKEEMKAMTAMFAEKAKQSVEEKGGLKDFKIENEEISEDGMTAKVTVLLTYGDGTTDDETNKYKKIDGKWRRDNSMK